jgi:hypothetical protein
MSLPVKSQQDLYDLFITTLQDYAPDLTDTLEGSVIDTLAGTFAVGAAELTRLIIDRFNKTFIELANGPEITGDADDLQFLAVDHFGEDFARPGAVEAVDTVTFARPNNSGGVVLIPEGTVVKTAPDADGAVQRYVTDSDVTMTASSAGSDTSVTVGVTASVAGADGNAAAGTINVIESSLLDTTITVSNVGNATGADAQDDSTYRETIRNLIQALAGATAAAVAAKAKTVTGVATATAIEQSLTVIQYDIATSSVVGRAFRLPVPKLYIADSTGTASAALLALVRTAIDAVRACGVFIGVEAATAVSVSWTGAITLNPSGPNYATFSSDPQRIVDSMSDYINGLPTGTSFVRATANAAILAIWGPTGTNDITAFTTSVPSGDVAASATQKLIAGTVGLS